MLGAPISIFLEVTRDCNLRCVYCSAHGGTRLPDELRTDELVSLVRQLAELRVFEIIITGGEPFVRDDIFLILSEICKHEFSFRVLTNGTLVTDDVARLIRDLGVSAVCISVDAAKAEVNDKIRGSGSFDLAVVAIKRLVAAGVNTLISAVLTKINMDSACALVKLGEELGCSGVAFASLRSAGRARECERELEVPILQRRRIAEELQQISQESIISVSCSYFGWLRLPDRRLRDPDGLPHLLNCGAARTSCAVTADGWILPCNLFKDFRCANVRRDDIARVWKDSVQMNRIRALSELPVNSIAQCARCPYHRVCGGGCRAEAYLCTGDLLGDSPSCWYGDTKI